jgi:hypothetical protein
MYNGTICWILLICLILGFLGWSPICWRCKNKKENLLLGPKNKKEEPLLDP